MNGKPTACLAKWSVLLGVLLVTLLLLRSARAEPPPAPSGPPDIGIAEKLGQTVPLSLGLVGEQGERVELGKLVDKPTILTLNYFRCTGLCTPLLNGVTDVLNKMGGRPGFDYQVITVSFDPRDNPELAAAKKQNYIKQLTPGFPPGAWRFLTGDPDSTRRLADAVGFKFAKVGGEYVHPGVIVILSPSGKVTRYMYGVTFLPLDLKMALVEAAEGRTGPTINKFLQFCYSYDPVGRGYYFNITRVVGAFTLLLAAAFVAVVLVRGKRPRPETGSS